MGQLPSTISSDILEEDIFDVLGASDLPEDEKGALIMQMLTLIHQRVFIRIMDFLTPQARTELENEVLNSEDAQTTETFLARYVPNYPELYGEEARKLRQQLIVKLAV